MYDNFFLEVYLLKTSVFAIDRILNITTRVCRAILSYFAIITDPNRLINYFVHRFI